MEGVFLKLKAGDRLIESDVASLCLFFEQANARIVELEAELNARPAVVGRAYTMEEIESAIVEVIACNCLFEGDSNLIRGRIVDALERPRP